MHLSAYNSILACLITPNGEIRRLEELQASVQGTQRIRHTLVSKWAAPAPWGPTARAPASNASVGLYLRSVGAHLIYYHRSDLLGRTVCMLRDFAWRNPDLADIGHRVDPQSGARLDAMRAQNRRALPSDQGPSVWGVG